MAAAQLSSAAQHTSGRRGEPKPRKAAGLAPASEASWASEGAGEAAAGEAAMGEAPPSACTAACSACATRAWLGSTPASGVAAGVAACGRGSRWRRGRRSEGPVGCRRARGYALGGCAAHRKCKVRSRAEGPAHPPTCSWKAGMGLSGSRPDRPRPVGVAPGTGGAGDAGTEEMPGVAGGSSAGSGLAGGASAGAGGSHSSSRAVSPPPPCVGAGQGRRRGASAGTG